jgi:hypothetical protein
MGTLRMTTHEHPIPSLVRLSSSLLVAFSGEKLAGSGSLLLRPWPIDEFQPSSPQILYEKSLWPKGTTVCTGRRLHVYAFRGSVAVCRLYDSDSETPVRAPMLRSRDYRRAHDRW